MVADLLRRSEAAEEQARKEAAIEETQRLAEEQRLRMRRSYEAPDNDSSYRSSSRLSYRDDSDNDSYRRGSESDRIKKLRAKTSSFSLPSIYDEDDMDLDLSSFLKASRSGSKTKDNMYKAYGLYDEPE